ncbi:hypothetical protein JZ751_005126 [Albula glossodonta]|uniref:Uncharacterized protein n=1 Tax=Albula glossodonta TaxID=121402 RepID=A0A8T2PDH8_9TELE|nr:hypothetical protein JZ751_005126 [Albula glossodonta]
MVKVCTFLAGNTLICHEQFMQCVSKKGVKIKEESMEKCDFILAFCPVSSRAGTDIAEALRRIEAQDKTDKAIILVVMHHTLNPNYVVHDSSEHLTRQHALALIVECLFHETKGLLRCSLNDKAVGHVRRQLKPKWKCCI